MHRLFGALCLLAPAAAAAADVHDFVGAEACGTCHEPQMRAWREGPHMHSLKSLSPRQQTDLGCRSCHTMVFGSDDPKLQGVQCESCHGPGRTYAPRTVMRDPLLAELLGLRPVTAKTCAGCHRGHAPSLMAFDFEKAVQQVCQNRLKGSDADPKPTSSRTEATQKGSRP